MVSTYAGSEWGLIVDILRRSDDFARFNEQKKEVQLMHDSIQQMAIRVKSYEQSNIDLQSQLQ